MSVLSDPIRFRRLTAAGCLLASPVLYVAGILVDPALRVGGEAIGVYGRFPGQVAISANLLHWSWVLLVPGVVEMIHLARHRAVLLAHITGAVALLGIVNFSALMLGDFFYSRLERDLSPAEGARIADAAFADPGAFWGYQLPGFAGLVGLLALGLVLARNGHAPWWASSAMVAGALVAPIVPFGTAAGGLLYLAGAGAIARCMIRTSDAEWAGQHAPADSCGPRPNAASTR